MIFGHETLTTSHFYDPFGDPGAVDHTPWTSPVVTFGRSDRPALQDSIDNGLDIKISRMAHECRCTATW